MIELHPLIDVIDEETKREAMILLSNIISWLAITLDSNEEYKKYILRGFLVLYDEQSLSNSINALLFCEGKSQLGIMEILRNPLSQYKGKFLPSILIEPESVRVKSNEMPETTTSLDESSITIEIADDSESEKDDDDEDPDEMQAKSSKKQET